MRTRRVKRWAVKTMEVQQRPSTTVSGLSIVYYQRQTTALGTERQGDSTLSHGLDYLSADAETLAARFKEKAASSDAARSSGVLEESIGQALLQPTIDDYEIHAVPFRWVSMGVYRQGLFY